MKCVILRWDVNYLKIMKEVFDDKTRTSGFPAESETEEQKREYM